MGKRRSTKAATGSKPEVVSGRSVVLWANNSSNTIQISPNSLFPRAAAIADIFQFYRFTKLKVTVIPTDTFVVIGYAPGAGFDTPPTSGVNIIELPIAAWHGAAKFYETTMIVPRRELIPDAQIPWFKTVVGTPATQFEIQGNLYSSVGAGATGGTVVIDYTIEFQSWNLAAQSPFYRSVKDVSDNSEKTSSPADREVVLVGGQTFKLIKA